MTPQEPLFLFPCSRAVGAFIEAIADGAVKKIALADVSVPRAADSAKNPVAGNGAGTPFADYLVADPKNQYPDEKKRKVETDKPGESDRDHGLGSPGDGADLDMVFGGAFLVSILTCAPQMTRTRPQLSWLAGWKRCA